MQLDFLENEHETRAFVFSVGVIVLTVIAIAAFVLTGGSILFYFFAFLEVALGFYMVYHMSKAPVAAKQPGRRPKGRARKQ